MKPNKQYENYATFLRLSKLPQRQDSLAEQISDLLDVANRLGLYDAADYLTRAYVRGKTD